MIYQKSADEFSVHWLKPADQADNKSVSSWRWYISTLTASSCSPWDYKTPIWLQCHDVSWLKEKCKSIGCEKSEALHTAEKTRVLSITGQVKLCPVPVRSLMKLFRKREQEKKQQKKSLTGQRWDKPRSTWRPWKPNAAIWGSQNKLKSSS